MACSKVILREVQKVTLILIKKYYLFLKERNITYFSLRVPTLSNAWGEIAEKLEQETKPGEELEISGYLHNEKESW